MSFQYKNKNVGKSIQFWNSEVSINQVANEIQTKTRMWANAEHRWRLLFNSAKFG